MLNLRKSLPPQLSTASYEKSATRLTGRKKPRHEAMRTLSDTALHSNMAQGLNSAAVRHVDINVASNELQKTLTPVGLKGLTWGTAVGTCLASIIAAIVTCVGFGVHVVPGLGFGLFLGAIIVCAAVGLIMQAVARRKAQADLGPHIDKLNAMEDELLLIPAAVRERTGDNQNLARVKLLKAQVNNSAKDKLAQMYAGFCDCVFSSKEAVGQIKVPRWSTSKAKLQADPLATAGLSVNPTLTTLPG
jgi:hypothetical protein